MGDTENKMHFINTPLPTHQRRIRHLRSIAARNVKSKGDTGISDLRLSFTLHSAEANPAFYTSETITGSVNPTWKSFTLDHLALEDVNTAKTTVIVRMWRENGGSKSLVIDWTVCLSGLMYFGDKLQKDVPFTPNTLLFGMFGGFYFAPEPKNTPITRGPQDCVLTVDHSLVKFSYTAMTTDRIQTIQRVIKQTQLSGRKARKNIEELLNQSRYTQQRKSARESVAMRVAMLHSELEWRTQRLRHEKDKYDNLQTHNIRRERTHQDKLTKLRNDRARLHEKKKAYFNVREGLIKTGAQLVMRRKQLISELTLVYPIIELPNTEYSILGVVLPNAEKLQACSDTQLEVALGYTCHLVQMIAQFLDMPLRYPMSHRGSKSLIQDHIMEKLNEKEREFPLYSKSRERFQFDYGVYLINKNIAQLRYYCSLGTTDLRLTLANLKTLLQLRLGVKFDHLESLRHANLQATTSINRSVTSQPVIMTSSPRQSPNKERERNRNRKPVQPEIARIQNGDRSNEKATKRKGQYLTEGSTHSGDTFDSNVSPSLHSVLEDDELFHKGSPDSFFNVSLPDESVTTSATLNNHLSSASNIPVSKPSNQNSSSDTFQDSSVNEQRVHKIGQNDHVDYNTSSDTDNLNALQAKISVDYDASSVASYSKQRTAVSPGTNHQPVSTLDQLTREKLLGPIANFDNIDISSSEDSTNAAYGQKFKFMREQTTLQSLMSDDTGNDENKHDDTENNGTASNDTKTGDENVEENGSEDQIPSKDIQSMECTRHVTDTPTTEEVTQSESDLRESDSEDKIISSESANNRDSSESELQKSLIVDYSGSQENLSHFPEIEKAVEAELLSTEEDVDFVSNEVCPETPIHVLNECTVTSETNRNPFFAEILNNDTELETLLTEDSASFALDLSSQNISSAINDKPKNTDTDLLWGNISQKDETLEESANNAATANNSTQNSDELSASPTFLVQQIPES